VSTWAEVIPLSSRMPQRVEVDRFSRSDEKLVIGILGVLADEMTARNFSYETRARLYFYLRLHGFAMQCWVNLLSVGHTSLDRQLAQRLTDTFECVTSPSILETDCHDDQVYRCKVAALSTCLDSFLDLIRSC
jgi:hypothetical protein